MDPAQVAQVRQFSRLVTQRVGALHDHFQGQNRPLGASRVLYEIGLDGADLRDLRARLDLDSGYLSRLVQSLVGEGLVAVDVSPDDERVRRAELTAAGLAELEEINRRSDRTAASILANLETDDRHRLVAAMAETCRLLRIGGIRIERADPNSSDVRWCVAQYFDELARRFEHGFDPDRVLPTQDAELRPPLGVVMLVSIDGARVGCASLKTLQPGIGYLKRMWVDRSMRGLGIGRRLLNRMEAEARQLGMTTLRLETNRALVEAIQLYRRSGYDEIAAFNEETYAHHWFEKQLT